MNNIIFKTDFIKYEISASGENVFLGFGDKENFINKTPVAFITNNNREIINSVAASFKDGILTVTFADDTVAEIEVSERKSYLTFTLKKISQEDFLSISYVNISVKECRENCLCLIGMTLSTHMKEHPGFNNVLQASAYPHIGLFKTNKSENPAKAAVIGTPKEMLRQIQKEVLKEVPKGELPISNFGGPYADNALPDAADTYTIFFETVTDKNIDDIIDSLKKFSINQIILHHYGHYTQGDFRFDENVYPGGMADFKKIVDRFHSEGIKVGLQTYSFFVVPKSSYVTPVPHKDLDTLKTFTLKEDISADDLSLSVLESTEGVTAEEGFIYVNSPYIWVDDEIIKFTKADDGKFEISERGALKTLPSVHKAGAKVKQLKEYFLIPLAKAGSPLFYEIARNTAKFYNESGADFFYLDALDGAFVLDGEDYVWYHAVDFIREMFKYLERDIIFDCCYNPQYTGSWFVRSRYGAIDVSLIAHRRFFDAHMNYNKETADKMGITGEMGWIDLYPDYEKDEKLWQSEIFSGEDLEYVCAKSYATGASIAFLEQFHKYKNTPRSKEYCDILKKYKDFAKENKPEEETVDFLKIAENSATLENGKLIKTRYESGIIRHKADSIDVFNPFEAQNAKITVSPLCIGKEYDSEGAVTLCEFNENEILKDSEIRFEKAIDSKGNNALGVWCYGDNSGAILCISLRGFALSGQRNGEHFIKIDFEGWKYFTFHENENETLPLDKWERRELEYKDYYNLQKFYHHYRPNINYSAIDGVDIKINGKCNIKLKNIRLIKHIETEIINPVIKTDCSILKVNTSLKYGERLIFDGKECIICDSFGNTLEKPSFEGDVILPKGKSAVSLKNENEDEVRCKLSFTIKGDKLQ